MDSGVYVIPERLVKFRIHNEGKNTSGMRADTQVRSTVELNLMLQEYAAIQEKEEFLRIFPEAKKYSTEDFFCAEYAFGRICTQEGMPSYTRIFGVQLLYDVLNDTEKAKIIVPDNAIANAFCITYFRFPFLLTQKNLKRFFFSNKYVFRYGATSITGANA